MTQYKKAISTQNLAIFCEQISMLLHSGILLHEGIRIMAEDAPEGPIKQALTTVTGELEQGRGISEALEKSEAFPPYLIHMAAVGNESGNLDATMSALSAYYKRQYNLQQTMRSAIIYPSILIVMMGAVLLLISIKVLPVFQTVLQSLGTQLSPAAATIMNAGQFMGRFSGVFLLLALIVVLVIFYFSQTQKGKAAFLRRISGTKTSTSLAQASLASSLATLLSTGVDPVRAVELSLPILSDTVVIGKTQNCLKLLQEEAMPLTEGLEKSGLFQGIAAGLLTTGLKAGSLDTAMQYVANLYDEHFEDTFLKKLSMIEPVSVTVLSILIGIILISVMLPLLGVMSAIGL